MTRLKEFLDVYFQFCLALCGAEAVLKFMLSYFINEPVRTGSTMIVSIVLTAFWCWRSYRSSEESPVLVHGSIRGYFKFGNSSKALKSPQHNAAHRD